jgi:hypothetical protein
MNFPSYDFYSRTAPWYRNIKGGGYSLDFTDAESVLLSPPTIVIYFI